MKQTQVGEVILFKGGLENFEMFGVSNESGCWVSLNDMINLLEFGKNAKKRLRKRVDENDVCMFPVQREGATNVTDEYFIRDSVVCDIILKEREERRTVEQFIFDVIGQLNGCTSYDVTDVKYAKEIKEYKEWLESEDEMFIAHKKDNKIDFWAGPSIDEALNILHKAGLE